MKKTFVLNGKGFFDEAGEEYELHDERVYVTQSNRVCLPGKAYLLMVKGVSLIANGLEVTYNDGTTEFFTDYHELEKDSYFDESSGGFENGWGCSVLHKVYYSLEGYRLSVGEVYRRVEFRKGKKYFTDTMRSTRYTFNLETGESFTLPERRASGNTSFSNTTEFHRFSYFMDAEKKCEDIPDGIVEQILDIMLDYKQRKLGFKPTVSRNGFKNVVSFLGGTIFVLEIRVEIL